MRAIAILAVFLHHALKIKLLWMGVDLFFVLSGFLITGVLLEIKRRSFGDLLRRFYFRRAVRILPPYLLTLALATVLLGTAWMRSWYLYIFLANLFLPLHVWHPLALEPLWSLAVEEQFYLLWPFAVYFLDRNSLRRLALALLVLAPLLRGLFLFGDSWPIYTLTPFRMDLLAAGALLALEWRRDPARIARRGPALGVLLAAVGIAGLGLLDRLHVTTYGNTRTGNVLIYECSLLFCLGFVLYALSARKTGWLCIRPLTYLGQISYTMYLVHLGVIGFAQAHFRPGASFAAALAITLAYASLSWFLMEAPLLGWGRNAEAAGVAS